MTTLFALWIASALLVGAMWTRRLARLRYRLAPPEAWLRDDDNAGRDPTDDVSVSVVVAAKDEAATIVSCVESVLGQVLPRLELIAVDDRSQDDTGALLRVLEGEAGGRMRCIGIDALPPGWTGKNHAVDRGVALATGEWLCFTDADTRLTSPRAISRVLRHARRRGADFVTVVPDLDAPTLYERLLQPLCCLVLVRWTRPQDSADPASAGAYANGPFMLVSRVCYEAIGGHRAVRAELNEDVRLAQLAKRRGFRLEVVEAQGLCRTRMYTSPRAMWNGWSRLFCGCSDSVRQIAATAIQLLIAGLFPVASLAVAIIGLARATNASRPAWIAVLLLWTFAVVVEHVAIVRIYRRIGGGVRWAAGFALAVLVIAGMLANAALRRRGATATVWRGTRYRTQEPPVS